MPIPCAFAQSNDGIIRQFADAGRRTWLLVVKPRFLQVMSPEEVTLLNSIEFSFPPTGGAYEAYAQVDRRRIVLSGGFVGYQDVAIGAFVFSEHFGRSDAFLPYLNFIHDEAVANYARIQEGQPVQLFTTFPQFAQISQDESNEYASSREAGAALYVARTSSLAFVIGHEFAHQWFQDGSFVSDADQRRRESRADEYAIKLIAKAGFSPLLAIPLMMFFYEGGEDPRHPPPLCRAANLALYTWPILESDLEFRQYVQKGHLQQQFDKAHRQFGARTEELQATCGDWLMHD